MGREERGGRGGGGGGGCVYVQRARWGEGERGEFAGNGIGGGGVGGGGGGGATEAEGFVEDGLELACGLGGSFGVFGFGDLAEFSTGALGVTDSNLLGGADCYFDSFSVLFGAAFDDSVLFMAGEASSERVLK